MSIVSQYLIGLQQCLTARLLPIGDISDIYDGGVFKMFAAKKL